MTVSGLDHSLVLPDGDLYTSVYLLGPGSLLGGLAAVERFCPHPVPVLLQTAQQQCDLP